MVNRKTHILITYHADATQHQIQGALGTNSSVGISFFVVPSALKDPRGPPIVEGSGESSGITVHFSSAPHQGPIKSEAKQFSSVLAI